MIPPGAWRRKNRPSRKRTGRSFVAENNSRTCVLVPTATGFPSPSMLFGIALVLAAACGPAGTSGTSGSPGASPSASAGGAASTLVIDRDTSDLISLDPAVLYEFSAVFATHNVYETLVKFEGTDL